VYFGSMIKDLEKLARLIEKEDILREFVEVQSLAQVELAGKKYPIFAFVLGSKRPEAPVIFITGGIHGLEKIGAQLAWSLLKTTLEKILWDKSLQNLLKNIRLVIVPLVNPTGFYGSTRSNSAGVDLMRNSPTKAVEKTHFLLGGHRISKKLPWYQGLEGVMEEETRAIVALFSSQAMKSRCVVALDFHSGFGLQDRLWFPFSFTSKPFDDLAEMHALTQLFEQTHPYHIYKIEPQSKGYLLNGDLWDHLFMMFRAQTRRGVFLPLTLEMGSWIWVKKNPFQLFSRQGLFNPVKEHRVKRIFRRHHLLFDFLLKAANSNEIWASLDQNLKNKHNSLGLARWYGK
jgi:hypothetical protein